MNFSTHADIGEAFVQELAKELGCPGEVEKAGRILRSTLHVYRDHSTPQESIALLGELPLFIKAVYVDGWTDRGNGDPLSDLHDFAARVRTVESLCSDGDLKSDDESLSAIKAVFRIIRKHITDDEEVAHLEQTLPAGLRSLLA